ncbi:TldD/PmbA family protein [Kribbella sp. GL6]|uniref:TldD/PmbA family protein n=1 Tax=Kribbella sp. GL6 TaxID=3419765 RepID=UPI003CFE2A40
MKLAQAVVDQARSRGLQHVEAVVRRKDSALTRFARSQIHQNIQSTEQVVQVRVVLNGAVGQAITNRLDDSGLSNLLDRAVATARQSRPDPLWPGLPVEGAGFVDLGADRPATAAQRAAAVDAIVAAASDPSPARSVGLVEVHGVVQIDHEAIAIASTTGLFATTLRPSVWVVVLAMAPDGGTGYAEERSASLDTIDVSALAKAACRDAQRTSSALASGRELPPAPDAELPAVLSEYVTADLVAKTARLVSSAARVADGSSPYGPGFRLGAELIRLTDDGHDASGVPNPFDDEGVRRRRIELVDAGRTVDVVHDSTTAAASGTTSTGHALGYPDQVGPLATNLFLQPGNATEDELIASIDDGLLVRRFYYTNALDPRRMLMTGNVRDGLFRIRGGELAEALAPARFRLSYLDLLRSVDAVGTDARTVSGWYGGVNILGDVTVPPVRVSALRL